MSRSSLFLCHKMKRETKSFKPLRNGVVKCHLLKRWRPLLSGCVTGLPKAQSVHRDRSCKPAPRKGCWEGQFGGDVSDSGGQWPAGLWDGPTYSLRMCWAAASLSLCLSFSSGFSRTRGPTSPRCPHAHWEWGAWTCEWVWAQVVLTPVPLGVAVPRPAKVLMLTGSSEALGDA